MNKPSPNASVTSNKMRIISNTTVITSNLTCRCQCCEGV